MRGHGGLLQRLDAAWAAAARELAGIAAVMKVQTNVIAPLYIVVPEHKMPQDIAQRLEQAVAKRFSSTPASYALQVMSYFDYQNERVQGKIQAGRIRLLYDKDGKHVQYAKPVRTSA